MSNVENNLRRDDKWMWIALISAQALSFIYLGQAVFLEVGRGVALVPIGWVVLIYFAVNLFGYVYRLRRIGLVGNFILLLATIGLAFAGDGIVGWCYQLPSHFLNVGFITNLSSLLLPMVRLFLKHHKEV